MHKDDVPSDLKGFTFDEYADFVSDVCNGTDPMYMEKTEFFTTCLSAMSDEFVTDGKVDYNKDSFKQLAEYTKNSTMQAGYGEFRDHQLEEGTDFLQAMLQMKGKVKIAGQVCIKNIGVKLANGRFREIVLK